MKIAELKKDYPLVYEAALSNQKRQNNKINDELNILDDYRSGNFNWDESPEGCDFWDSINKRNMEKAKSICPDLLDSIEPKRYYGSLSNHIGRYIKALVDGPLGCPNIIKAGDIGRIVDSMEIDFPNYKGYLASSALTFASRGLFELMPEDYNPESEVKNEFQVGKWHKAEWQKGQFLIYIKPSSVKDTNIECKGENSIWTVNGKFTEVYLNASYHPKDLKLISILDSIEEIQQYLPENHEDKAVWIKPERGFYVKYCEEFTEDLFNAFFKWAKDVYGEYKRKDVPIDYELFKTWYQYIWVNEDGGFKYSLDNNPQTIKKQFSISELKTLINYQEPASQTHEKPFVLPKDWHFKVNKENYNQFKHARPLSTSDGFITSLPYGLNDKWGLWTDSPNSKSVEITFEQFKEHVLDKKDEFSNITEKAVYNESDLLAEAIRRYPPGTRVKSAYNPEKEYICGKDFKFINDCIYTYIDGEQYFFVYYKGNWAEIISSPRKYKIGDWCYIINKRHAKLENRKVYQINEISENGAHFDNGSGKKNNQCWVSFENFRLALIDEIPKNKNLVIADNDSYQFYDSKLNNSFDKEAIKNLPEKGYTQFAVKASKTPSKAQTTHLLDKQYSSELNKEFKLPKRVKNKSKKLIY